LEVRYRNIWKRGHACSYARFQRIRLAAQLPTMFQFAGSRSASALQGSQSVRLLRIWFTGCSASWATAGGRGANRWRSGAPRRAAAVRNRARAHLVRRAKRPPLL